MGKCRYCGREVGGYRDFSLSPICPECELVKLEKERQVEEQRQQAENEWRQREQEFAAQKRHEEEEEEKQRRHEEQLSAIRYAEEERQRRHEEELYAIAAAEEANQRRFEESQTLQQQDNDFENSKMRCLWCGDGYTFRNGEGHGVYCSKKCALDDLGKNKYREYLKQIDILLQEKVIQDIEAKQYLSAIICAEGCKNLPVDLKGKIGHCCLKIPNRNIDQSWGKMILKEAVLAGSFASAKLFLLHNPFTNLSCSAYSKMAKLLLPYFEFMEKDFYSASDSIEKLDALEQISLKWKGSSIARGKIFEFIQKRKNDFSQAEYDTALKCKNSAKSADKYFEAAELFNVLANKDFKDARQQVEICRNIAYQIEYNNALRQKTNAKTAKAYFEAAELFDALINKDFKDTRQQIEICRNMAIQKKIDFATKMEKKAYKFEDYLKLLILYLELTELKVENANLWLDIFYSKAIETLKLYSSPESYGACMQLIDMIAEKGFSKASVLRQCYMETIEKLWEQASSNAVHANNKEKFYEAIRCLKKFKSIKTETKINNVFQEAIKNITQAISFKKYLIFSMILGFSFAWGKTCFENSGLEIIFWMIFIVVAVLGYAYIFEEQNTCNWLDRNRLNEIKEDNILIIDLGSKYISKELPSTIKCIHDCDKTVSESINKVIISEFIDAIGKYAFAHCSNLTNIIIPTSVVKICDGAFCECKNLTRIIIPSSVTEIGDNAFEHCRKLINIIIPKNVEKIGNGAFKCCSNLTTIVIPEGVTRIGDDTFVHCSNLTNVVIPDSITEIGEYAFAYCSNLNNVVIPDSVTRIGDNAFNGCENLTNIVIPDSVTKIGKYAFYKCKNLTNIVITDGVTEIGDNAFEYCEKLTNIVIPDSVTKIGYALWGCENLESITISKKMQIVKSSLPEGCKIKYRD